MVKIQKEKKPRKPRATLKQNQMMRGAKAPASSIDARKSNPFPSHQQNQAVVVNINKPTRGRPKKVFIEKRSSPKEKKPESNISFHPVISMPQYSIDST